MSWRIGYALRSIMNVARQTDAAPFCSRVGGRAVRRQSRGVRLRSNTAGKRQCATFLIRIAADFTCWKVRRIQ
jgi:hypothetical protein